MSIIRIVKLTVLFAAAALILPSMAVAGGPVQEIRQPTIGRPDVVQLDQAALAEILAIQADCGRCHAHIAGSWRYTLLRRNIPHFSENIRFFHNGLSFKGVGDMYTVVGSARGTTLNFTMVVTGEEGEGYVIKVDASVNRKRITGVYLDSNGEVGSFVAFRVVARPLGPDGHPTLEDR